MATVPTITTIQKTECIGNSLVTINSNYDNIRNSFTSVNTDITLINNALNNLTSFVNSISSAQLAKAWVGFTGRRNTIGPSGTFDLTNTNRFLFNRYNVANVFRNGTGDYTINLSIQLNANFIVSGITSSKETPSTFTGLDAGIVSLHPVTPFPGNNGLACRIITVDANGSFIDPTYISLTMFSN